MSNALLALAYRLALAARDAWIWLRRPQTIGVRVLVLRADAAGPEVLLIRHRAGPTPWDLPGGGVGHREPIATAARREVLEEAGLHIRVERLLGAFDNFRRWRSDATLVLVATPLGEPQAPRHSLEIAEARFFRLDALPARMSPGSRRCIAGWRRGAPGLLGDWWE